MEPKVVLITGSSSGIGKDTALLYSKKGYKVAVHGSNKEKVDKVVAECILCSPHNYQALGLVLDFTVDTNGGLAVKKTVEHFGRLDVLVNNAGVFLRSSPYEEGAYENYKRLMAINIDSTVNACITAVDYLRKTKGNIVFVSSIASLKPALKGFAYSMSKSSMTMFAKCLAIELAPDVRVNVVSPGPVDTPIFERSGFPMTKHSIEQFGSTTLINRIGTSEEIAKSIFFLSDEAFFINGHELVIDGGYLLKSGAAIMSQVIAKVLSEGK